MPNDLDQVGSTASQNEKMAAERVALEDLLHQQRQAADPLAPVSVAGRQPHSGAARQRGSSVIQGIEHAPQCLAVDDAAHPQAAPCGSSISISPAYDRLSYLNACLP